MRKNINPQAIEIQRRFFQALDLAVSTGKVKGLATFCREHNLNRVKYSRIKNSLDKPAEETLYKIIDLDALAGLCRDFNVSADWLLLGKGKMLTGHGKRR